MKKSLLATAIALTAYLAGCNRVQAPVTLSTPFPNADLAHYSASGSATIAGQAFMRQNGGGVVTCAGSLALLMPDLPYFSEAVAHARNNQNVDFAADQQHAQSMVRKSTCDAQGNFVFTNLPVGGWIVTSRVHWVVADVSQGGTLLQRGVQSKAAQETKVLLTDSDLAGL